MAYYEKIMINTVNAINKCYDSNFMEINVRRIRKCNSISSKERSKITFISRALEDLKEMQYLEFIGRNSPKKYKILGRINIEEFKSKFNH